MGPPLFGLMAPFAAHAGRAYNIYAIGDPRHWIDVSQKFLKQLLQMKAWHTATECQVSVVVVPCDFPKDEFVRTAVNAPADGFVNAVVSTGSFGRRFHFHSHGCCRSFREFVLPDLFDPRHFARQADHALRAINCNCARTNCRTGWKVHLCYGIDALAMRFLTHRRAVPGR